MIDLRPFCSKDEYRYFLHKPFNVGDHTYATNGLICVRVALRIDTEPHPKPPDVRRLAWNDAATFMPVETFALPPTKMVECEDCDGRGTMHDCPSCECDCDRCRGQGEIADSHIFAEIAGTVYCITTARLLFSLPGLTVARFTSPQQPIQFRFDGGDALAMPVTRVPKPDEGAGIYRAECVSRGVSDSSSVDARRSVELSSSGSVGGSE